VKLAYNEIMSGDWRYLIRYRHFSWQAFFIFIFFKIYL